MKTYFTTLLDVFNNVISFTTNAENKPITDSVPALADAIEVEFTNKVNAIEQMINPQGENETGYASEKNTLKNDAAMVCMSIVNAGKGFANQTGDLVLFGKINYSYSSLRKTRDALFAEVVRGVVVNLTPLLAQLTPYGVTQASFDAVTDAVDAYVALREQPRQQIVGKKTVNILLEKMFSDTNDFLRTVIDPIVYSLQLPQDAYCTGYRVARKQVPYGVQHTRLVATVVNEIGEPYVEAKVTVDGFTDVNTGKSYEPVSGFTDINGNVIVEKFFGGIRTVTISGANVHTLTSSPIEFKNGDAVTREFVCAPAFENIPASAIIPAATVPTE